MNTTFDDLLGLLGTHQVISGEEPEMAFFAPNVKEQFAQEMGLPERARTMPLRYGGIDIVTSDIIPRDRVYIVNKKAISNDFAQIKSVDLDDKMHKMAEGIIGRFNYSMYGFPDTGAVVMKGVCDMEPLTPTGSDNTPQAQEQPDSNESVMAMAREVERLASHNKELINILAEKNTMINTLNVEIFNLREDKQTLVREVNDTHKAYDTLAIEHKRQLLSKDQYIQGLKDAIVLFNSSKEVN